MASSGVYYNKEDLIHLISSNKNPICVVTGKKIFYILFSNYFKQFY